MLLIVVAFATWAGSATWGSGQSSGIFQAYPIGTVTPTPPPFTPGPQPTLIPSPTPTPTPPPETRIALDYIATREGIPVERLFPVNQHHREYGALGKTFWYVKALDRESHHIYTAMVDLSDQSPVELEDIERAQREALEAKYGKLEPQLYELLQTKGPDDEVNVAVWFTPIDLQALVAQLSATYPQVPLEALERPWHDVKDQALADQIRADYLQLMEEAHLAKQDALAQSLRALGYQVKLHRGIPSLVARLPKRVILEIAQRDDVTRLYLIEGQLVPLLDSAIPTARGNVVWRRGIEGDWRRIAILEPGILHQFHPSINVLAVRDVVSPLDHTAGVASAAASHHATYKGMAPEAAILSAGVDGGDDQWDDVDDAILWARDRYARIMNASFSSETGEKSDDMQWIDRVFDYYARYDNITMIASAGNQKQGNHIGSPAKGYNVIAVGGTDDKNNSAWDDDVIWWDPLLQRGSAWQNPKRDDGTYGDREKPEVVAAAKGLTLLDLDNGTWVDSGTSYSAPQVAGLAALLADRNSDLADEPEAMRAIIMASAVHNIEGPSGIPTGQDLKDGAGAIDAAVADTIAATGYSDVWQYPYPACESPCWWSNLIYNNYPGHPGNFPPGTYRWYYFEALTGERIRVALAWVSNPAGPGSNYWEDPLETKLDLIIYDPDWDIVQNGLSLSSDNSYELVDFVAPKTGEYKIGVFKNPGTTEYLNWIGIAWTKQATYLPDIKANYNGWTSELVIRNDGAASRSITTRFFDPNGTYVGGVTCPDVPSGGTCSFSASIAVNNFSGSAIVDGSEEVSVVVENQAGSSSYAYNGIAAADSLNPDWSQVGTTIHLPLLMDDNGGWSTSVTILNTGSGTANFDFDYFGQNSGGPYQGPQGSLGPNASVTYGQLDSSCPTVGAGYITSDQPLAVIVREHSGNVNMAYNGFSAGATTVSLPLIMANNYGWHTGIAVQNLGPEPTNVTVNYYGDPSRNPETVYDVQPYATAVFVQSGGQWGSTRWVGSARVTASQPIAAIVNQTTTGKGSSYSGFTNGSGFIALPDVRNNHGGWTSGVQVQNLDSDWARVVVRVNGSETWLGIEGYKSVTLNPVPGTWPGFRGPVTLECTNGRRIAAIVNTVGSGEGDLMMTYNGINH